MRPLPEETAVSLRVHLERLIDERDRQYAERFRAQELALDKASQSLADYKASANEFRGALADQANTLVTRVELTALLNAAQTRMSAFDTGISELRIAQTQKLGLTEYETRHDALLKQVQLLQQLTAASTGQRQGTLLIVGWLIGGMGVLIAVVTAIVTHH